MNECGTLSSYNKGGVEDRNCDSEVLMIFRVYRADVVLTSVPAKGGLHKQRTIDITTTHRLIV